MSASEFASEFAGEDGSASGGKGKLEISEAWIRLMPPVSKNTAGYFTLANHSGKAVCLTGATTSISRVTELHEMYEKNGARGMRPLGIITLEPGEVVEFAPGGKHMMLIDLNAPLQEGQVIDIQLLFRDHAPVNARAEVRR